MKNFKTKRYTGFATVDLLIAIAIAAALTGIVVYQISSPIALNITGMSCAKEQQLAADISACGLAYLASGGTTSSLCSGIDASCTASLTVPATYVDMDTECAWDVIGDGIEEVTLDNLTGAITVNCTNDI